MVAIMNARTLDPLAEAARAIKVLGGPVKAARRLGVKDERHQTVQSWLRSRVPTDYCPLIERETRLEAEAQGDPSLIVLCEQLRPDVAWSVLREQSSATPDTPATASAQEA